MVYVFTDASCPYCHKLHEHIPEITAQGIEVRYIAWPRGEQFMPAMESVCVAQTVKLPLIKRFQVPNFHQRPVKPSARSIPVGSEHGVNGTPAIYNEDGEYLGGYLAPSELLNRLK